MRMPGLFPLILVLSVSGVGYAADLYVATTGVDAGDCTDSMSPCGTIQYALNVAAALGDVIHVEAGTYVENVFIDKAVAIDGAGDDLGGTTVDGSAAESVFVISGVFEVTFSNMAITNGLGLRGGGILNHDGLLTVTNCNLYGNSADFGGAIDNSGTVSLNNCRITGNTCSVSGGGISSDGTLAINDSTISDNDADDMGGGIIDFGGTVKIFNTTITGNSAVTSGGGISGDGTLTAVNTTVSGNTGGGIFCFGGTTELYNTAVVNNESLGFSAGGISQVVGVLSVANSILANNAGPSSPDCFGTITSDGYNLIEDTTGCTITGDDTGNITAVDPLLGPLQDNGGPTYTHALLAGSPAIDAGNPAGCTDENGLPLVTDQRGAPRPQDCGGGLRCDIGAYEACSTIGFTVYESTVPWLIVDPGNAVGTATVSPYDHAPAIEPELYYQVDDGAGAPDVIKMVKGGLGVLIHF